MCVVVGSGLHKGGTIVFIFSYWAGFVCWPVYCLCRFTQGLWAMSCHPKALGVTVVALVGVANCGNTSRKQLHEMWQIRPRFVFSACFWVGLFTMSEGVDFNIIMWLYNKYLLKSRKVSVWSTLYVEAPDQGNAQVTCTYLRMPLKNKQLRLDRRVRLCVCDVLCVHTQQVDFHISQCHVWTLDEFSSNGATVVCFQWRWCVCLFVSLAPLGWMLGIPAAHQRRLTPVSP